MQQQLQQNQKENFQPAVSRETMVTGLGNALIWERPWNGGYLLIVESREYVQWRMVVVVWVVCAVLLWCNIASWCKSRRIKEYIK